MVKKENIKSGLVLVVNDKKNTIEPSVVGLNLYSTFKIGDGTLIPTGSELKCLSGLRSEKSFSGKVVDVSYNGNFYVVYWCELRVQTNYHVSWFRKEKLEQIENIYQKI